MPPIVTVYENGIITVKCYAGSQNDCIEFSISLSE